MSEIPADLEKAVRDQAEARVAMNVQGYAKYLTPEAVDSLRASFPGMPPRVGRYEIDKTESPGGDYVVNVRYFVRDDSFVVRSRWHQENETWIVTHAERLWDEGEKRPGVLSRIAATLLARRRRG
jgi:hypothetical protein